MAYKNILRTVILFSLIINLNILDAQQTNQTEIEYSSSAVLSQPSLRPEYLKTQAQSSEPVLVILVYFPDTDLNIFAKTTQDHWNNLFFGSKPSIKDYFAVNSYGKLDLVPAKEDHTPKDNGVIGWYMLPESLSVYKSKYLNINECYGQIIKDSITASKYAVKYSNFDANTDGYISSNELHIYVIWACFEQFYYDSNPIPEPLMRRGHLFLFYKDKNICAIHLELDGKKIGYEQYDGGFSVASELLYKYPDKANNRYVYNEPTKVGFLAHEMGHDLGLPDHYYNPDNASIWCLMGAGDVNVPYANYPHHICATHKEQLGWINPTIIKTDLSLSISQIEATGECLKLWENGNPSDEYFLIENRNNQASNNYDSSLPASGLLIWHIDKKKTVQDKNQGVALEEADNNKKIGDAGDLFIKGKAFLENSSNPNSRKNPPDDDITGVAVNNISAPGAVMTAEIKVSHVPSSIHFNAHPNFVLTDGVLNSSVTAYLLDTWKDTVESVNNQISFNITQGQNYGSLMGINPINAQNGSASIDFLANSLPGTVTIEVAYPGLNTEEVDIFVFDLGTIALRFDGKDDYVEILDNSEPAQYTIEAWVKVFEIYDSNIIVRTGNNGPYSAWSHQLRIRDWKFEHYLWDGSSYELQGTTIIQKGDLYHVAGIASNNGMMRLFVNGREEGNAHSIGTMNQGLNRYLIGHSSGRSAEQGSGIQYFNGIIYEVRISNNFRYTSNFSPEPIPFAADENTIGLFHFDEGSGQITQNSVTGLSDGKLGSTSEQDSNDPTWINFDLLASPRLLSPEDNSVLIGSLNFRWEKENNAKNFHLQLSPDSDFSNISWQNSTIPGDATAFQYPATLLKSDLAHHCRINYSDFNGSRSEWSETRKFKLLEEFQGNELINENFNSGKFDFSLNGNSKFQDGYILLVPNAGGQGGSIFYIEPFIFSSFEATFSAFFGENRPGADGLCFIWQANSPQALGLRGPNHGGCLGYEGIDNSYAVEFDTWHNGEHGDPSDNHVGFDMNGNLKSVVTNSNIPILEDNTWHDIRVRFENQTLYVWMDEKSYLDYKVENYDASKAYYFGFSAATGAAMNNHKIDNFILKVYTSTSVKETDHHEDFMAYDCDVRNYPNPFNNQTTIEFSLPQRQHVTVKIYNLLGQEICSLVNSDQNPGRYKILWNSEDYSVDSGLHFIELKIGRVRKMIKSILLK